ncbi:MAG: hypothetical protein B7Y39_16160 [Bdellovibrio sp. 28-41-41]|nr:MAG: hypothetical protein B7Y39_16160 [Bdellovibrio sp. 28-41-41]
MSEKSCVKKLTDLVVDSNLRQLVTSEREILTEIIIYIREVDCRKLYLSFGYPSLFEYLTRRMGYSNASAQRRVNVARLSNEVPVVMDHVESGEIKLSQISVMAQAIRQVNRGSDKVSTETKEQLISELVGKSLNQTEVIVSAALNIPLKQHTKAKHQKDESVRFEVTLTKEQWEKFNRARDILSTSLSNGSWDQVIESMSDQVILKKDKATPRLKARTSKITNSQIKKANLNSASDATKASRTAIPKSVQHEVFARDRCCQYQSKITGHKCSSTWNLTLDHVQPIWAGGKNEASNLRVFCANHNIELYRQQAGIRSV